MTAITSGIVTNGVSPALGKKMLYVQTPATADSADTIDLTSSAVTNGETLSSVDFVIAWDQSTGDIVTVTESSGTITIDAAGSTTDHTYGIVVIGDA